MVGAWDLSKPAIISLDGPTIPNAELEDDVADCLDLADGERDVGGWIAAFTVKPFLAPLAERGAEVAEALEGKQVGRQGNDESFPRVVRAHPQCHG